MELWEKEYIDTILRIKNAQKSAKNHAYEEGYDSSRWEEKHLPDGKKYYVPKENASLGTDRGWVRTGRQKSSTKIPLVTLLVKAFVRLLFLFIAATILFFAAGGSADLQNGIAIVYAVVSLAVVLWYCAVVFRCAIEGRLEW